METTMQGLGFKVPKNPKNLKNPKNSKNPKNPKPLILNLIPEGASEEDQLG